MKTQSQRIIEYIDRKGSISSMEAFRYCGITSLHRRLADLRKAGYVFGDGWWENGKTAYKTYWIEKRPKKCQ